MSSETRDNAYLHTNKRALAKIEQQVEGVDYAVFLSDLYIAVAVAMQLSVFGETARKLSLAFKDQFRQVKWTKIIGLRHLIAQEYEKLYPAKLWDVAIDHAACLSATSPFPPSLND